MEGLTRAKYERELEAENAELRAEVESLKRDRAELLGPYSTMQIALKARESVNLQVEGMRKVVEVADYLARKATTPHGKGLGLFSLIDALDALDKTRPSEKREGEPPGCDGDCNIPHKES